MNELNVFNNSWSPWKYPSNWIRNARMFFRQFKWAYQRVTRGFSDPDWWDMDTHMQQLLANMIEYLADHTVSYPGRDEWKTPEDWDKYLREIVAKLRYSLNEDLPNEYEEAWLKTFEGKDLVEAINDKTEEERAITNAYLNKDMENWKKRDKALFEALDMIVHCWHNLWD